MTVMASEPSASAPSDTEPRPIRAQYSGHVTCPDQSEDRNILGSAPPPFSLASLDEGNRRRRVKKARRKVRNIKIVATCMVIVLFLMGFV